MSAESTPAFDVSPWLKRIKFHGKDVEYLLVAGRVQWLRHDDAEAQITTKIHTLTDKLCVVEAMVTSGSALATGVGSETPADFGDYIEKAETKAVGRALALLGYGTNAVDLDEGNDHDGTLNVVDSPRPAPRPSEREPKVSLADQLKMNRLVGDAPRGLTTALLIKALNESGWEFAESSHLTEIVQGVERRMRFKIQGTKEGGGYWPSDVWNFLADREPD